MRNWGDWINGGPEPETSGPQNLQTSGALDALLQSTLSGKTEVAHKCQHVPHHRQPHLASHAPAPRTPSFIHVHLSGIVVVAEKPRMADL